MCTLNIQLLPSDLLEIINILSPDELDKFVKRINKFNQWFNENIYKTTRFECYKYEIISNELIFKVKNDMYNILDRYNARNKISWQLKLIMLDKSVKFNINYDKGDN